MPEEKIILPSFLVADLYKDQLVVLEQETGPALAAPTPAPATPPAPSEPAPKPETAGGSAQPAVLGENLKNVVIVVREMDSEVLEADSLELLLGMLKACKLALRDVVIVNLNRLPRTYTELHEAYHGKQYLLFGVSAGDIDLPFAFPYYQVQQFSGSVFLSAPPLELLKADTVAARTEKSKLWVCLKQIFQV